MATTRTCSQCGHSVSQALDRCPEDGTPFYSEEVMARVGMVLHDHEIQAVIGEGGMGVVYRAQHVVIEKPVAIKVLYDHFARQKEMVEQFIIEAKAASRIRHPNIIDVTDFGTTAEGLVFLIMEFLDGESLQERLGRVGRLPVFDAVNIVKQVARGLGAAHELGIVHRDLKPANIFLCQREGRRRIVSRTSSESGPHFVVEPEDKFDFVKLLDFGVAKFMDLGPSAATRAGVLCGTPHYLSPEQAQEQPATERSDIYSLGAVFYEMVTGSVPYDGTSMFEILKGHVVGDLMPPSRRAPDARIGPQVDAVIARCLDKQPARRFGNTDELCEALSECVGERAFLRDAHRLPGIERAGLDLSEATAAARKAQSTKDDEKAFAAVEMGSDWADLAEPEERPDRRGRRRERRDTARIGRRRSGTTAVLLFVLVVAAGGVLWAFRERLGLMTATTGPTTSPSPTADALAARVGGTATAAQPESSAGTSTGTGNQPSLAAVPPSAPVSPRIEVANAGTGTKAQAATQAAHPADRTADRPAEAVAARPRVVVATPPRPRTGPSMPMPTPELPPAPPPAPPPQPAAAPPEPAADVNALLREAQQAWSRRYYGVAIDKARAVLRAAPGRLDAYQIIAVCSCAIGAADDAREAITHLDLHKQKLVQTLCRNHGVALE